MKQVLRIVVVCAICLAAPNLVRGQVAESGPAPDHEELADSLRAFAYHMADLLRTRNVGGVVGLYGDTVQFVHIDNGDIVPWSQLSVSMRRYLETATSNPLTLVGEPGVTIVDTDNAILYLVHRFAGSGGMEPHEGVWTGVLHRFQSGWRIVHSHSSDRGGE